MVHEEELYINNKRVDTDGKTKVALSLRSNLLQDISKIISNHTYTVKLPSTTNNQDIISHADLVQRTSDFAYSVHKARFLRNGIEIINNGRAVVMKTGENGIEVSVVWGLFPAFSNLVSNGIKLNDLETEDKLLYQVPAVFDTYEQALEKDFFYAYYDPIIKVTNVNYEWKNGSTPQVYPEYPGRHTDKTLKAWEVAVWTGSHASSGGTHTVLGAENNQHPCVKVSYILRLIKELLGVTFEWSGEAKEYIDTLIIPLVKHNANELTYGDTFVGAFQRQTQLGRVAMSIDSQSAVFEETTGIVDELTANVTADTIFKVSGAWEFEIPEGSRPTSQEYMEGGSVYDVYVTESGCYLKMKVGEEEYIIGENKREKYRVPQGYHGVVKKEMSAEGKVSLQRGQKVTIELSEIQGGVLRGMALTSGDLQVTVMEEEDVPVGGYFPIAHNLPDIKVIDLVKFLACITGTFPLQIADDERVTFIPIADVWKNTDKAIDWTDKVVAPHPENKPKSLEYSLSDWKQHNRYKWKEDDTVVGDYDGDLVIENDSLELERDVFTFPFAATDGNNVPTYERGEGNTFTYKACKDRILRLAEGKEGVASTVFDIDMQEILKQKYAELTRTLQRVKLIHENVILSDAELQKFDESIPVYLAQYGRYFAVIEIKSEGNGVCDCTLLELVLR